jgi:alanyl-tRNA synthetase
LLRAIYIESQFLAYHNHNKVEKVEFIPMDQNQIMYVNSGVYNETKNFIIPFLENARRPYRQLSLIEDAIVIYRLS